jgi:hypothetical protein
MTLTNVVRAPEAARRPGRMTAAMQAVSLSSPLPSARPALPLAANGGLASSIDWDLTILAAFSFLLHFGVIGAMYSDWMDPVIDAEVTAGGLIDTIQRLPPAPVETSEESPATPSTPSSPATTSTALSKSSSVAEHGGRAGPSKEQKAEALADRAHSLQMELVSTLNAGPALDGAMRRSEIPAVSLDRAAESASSISFATGTGLHFGEPAGIVRPAHVEIVQIGVTVGDHKTQAGPESVTAGPRGVAILDPLMPTGAVPNAERVIAGLRAGFRACYNRGLQADPSMFGRVLMSAKIAPNGEVVSVNAEQDTGLSESVVQCIRRRVETAQFDSASVNGSTLKIPVTFVQQVR